MVLFRHRRNNRWWCGGGGVGVGGGGGGGGDGGNCCCSNCVCMQCFISIVALGLESATSGRAFVVVGDRVVARDASALVVVIAGAVTVVVDVVVTVDVVVVVVVVDVIVVVDVEIAGWRGRSSSLLVASARRQARRARCDGHQARQAAHGGALVADAAAQPAPLVRHRVVAQRRVLAAHGLHGAGGL